MNTGTPVGLFKLMKSRHIVTDQFQNNSHIRIFITDSMPVFSAIFYFASILVRVNSGLELITSSHLIK